MEEKGLITYEETTALAAFTSDEGLDPYIKQAEDIVSGFDHDLSTAAGRKRTASLAAKVAKLKVKLDELGKDLVSDWKTKAKAVDKNRKAMRDSLDELKVEARKPLTEWEDEQARIEAEKAAKEEAEKLLAQLNTDHELALLMDEKVTAELEEAARLAEEARIEAEDKIRREAAEAARIEAEDKAKAEREKLEREKAEAEAATKEADRQRIAAEERAKLEAEQAERNRAEAKREADQAVIDEADRVRQEQKDKEEAERLEKEKRESNKRHAKKINNQAVDCFVANGFSKDEAIKIVTLIAKKEVTNIVINY